MEQVSTERPYDMRRHARRPSVQPVYYLVSTIEAKNRTWLSCKGQLLDASETGICIQTDLPLAPGHIVWFNETIENRAGFVRWCRQLDSIYKSGIELDEIHVGRLDAATDLFNERMEDIEKRCDNPEENPGELYKATLHAVEDVLVACKDFEEGVRDRDIIRDARIRFHQKTNHILSKSYCLNRARIWPQGYQGDYKTLEGIYRNTPLSDGIGYYLDLCALNFPLADAVRNRIRKLESILRYELRHRKAPSVLNIACGSCREVFELVPDIEESGARFTCIDLDDDALTFAANRLSLTSLSPAIADQIVMRKYNAMRMFDYEMNQTEFGMQDVIYSVGLFDYLPTDFLATLLRSLYLILKPGGKLITSFKDASRYRSQEYHWLADWDGFLQRTETDFRNILSDAGMPDALVEETREESGIIIFYIISR